MSEENVEIVRLAYERLNAWDIDGFLEFCASDVEFRDLPALPGSGVFIGHDAVRGWYAQLRDAFKGLRFQVDELIDFGARVAVDTLAAGHGRSSGAKVELHFTSVWTVRDAKLIHHIAYSDHAEALEDAGLRE